MLKYEILTLTYSQKCRKETHYSHNQQAASLLISARRDFGFYIGARHHRHRAVSIMLRSSSLHHLEPSPNRTHPKEADHELNLENDYLF